MAADSRILRWLIPALRRRKTHKTARDPDSSLYENMLLGVHCTQGELQCRGLHVHMHIRTKYSRVLTITGQPISHLGRTYLYLLSTTIWYGLQNSGLALKGVPSSNQCCPIYMQFKFEIQWEFQGDLILRHSYNTYRWSPLSLVSKLSTVFSHRCVVRWVSHFATFVRTQG